MRCIAKQQQQQAAHHDVTRAEFEVLKFHALSLHQTSTEQL
jgi:hypothetical protein